MREPDPQFTLRTSAVHAGSNRPDRAKRGENLRLRRGGIMEGTDDCNAMGTKKLSLETEKRGPELCPRGAGGACFKKRGVGAPSKNDCPGKGVEKIATGGRSEGALIRVGLLYPFLCPDSGGVCSWGGSCALFVRVKT